MTARGNAHTETILDAENVDWEYVEDVHISRINMDPEDSQVRVRTDLDEDNVRGMVKTVEQGRDLPPGVVLPREDGNFDAVDMNHRGWSIRKADIPYAEKTIDVYVIKPTSKKQLSMLTLRLNNETNGLAPDKQDRYQMAASRYREQPDVTFQELAERTGLHKRSIMNYVHREKVKYALRAKGDFSSRELSQLRASDFDKLHRVKNPEIRAAIARITLEAELSSVEVGEFVTDVNEAATDKKRWDIVQQWQDDTQAAQDDETNSDPVPARYPRRLHQIEELITEEFGNDLDVLTSSRRNNLALRSREVAHLLLDQAEKLEVS